MTIYQVQYLSYSREAELNLNGFKTQRHGPVNTEVFCPEDQETQLEQLVKSFKLNPRKKEGSIF